MKTSFELDYNGDRYAVELARPAVGFASITFYENAYLTTNLPPVVALVFAQWLSNAVLRTVERTPLERSLLCEQAAALALTGHEKTR